VRGRGRKIYAKKKLKNSQKLKIYPELTKKKSKTNPRSSRFKRKKSKKKKKKKKPKSIPRNSLRLIKKIMTKIF
jgi:hypothetical protein